MINEQRNKVIIIVPYAMPQINLAGSLSIPYGALYIADSMINNGFVPYIFHDTNENIMDKIGYINEDSILCFAISTMSGTQLRNSLNIADMLRAGYPNIKIIWGGVHVTVLPEQTLKDSRVDIIIWGEGENTILIALRAIQNNNIKSLKGEPGIGIKINNETFIGSNSGYTNLDGKVFHLPYFLLDMERYSRKLAIGVDREYPIWTSRGCPFACHFCSNSSKIWSNRKMRHHSIEHIVNDVKMLYHEYKADCITFADEGFLLDENRFIEILKALKKENMNLKYRFATRVDLLNRLSENTWKLMKECRVIGITIAPESGSPRILESMGKKITLDEIYKANALLDKYGMFKSFQILICTPEETREDFHATLWMIDRLAQSSYSSPYPFSINKYIPLPGTQLYDQLLKKGYKIPETLDGWCLFDFEDMADTRNTVRPWISKDNMIYYEQNIRNLNDLNHEFNGKNVNKRRIEDILFEMRHRTED